MEKYFIYVRVCMLLCISLYNKITILIETRLNFFSYIFTLFINDRIKQFSGKFVANWVYLYVKWFNSTDVYINTNTFTFIYIHQHFKFTVARLKKKYEFIFIHSHVWIKIFHFFYWKVKFFCYFYNLFVYFPLFICHFLNISKERN